MIPVFNNKKELFAYYGEAHYIASDVHTQVGCDKVWVDVDDHRMSIIATVGSDKEVAKTLEFPFTAEDFHDALNELALEVTW